MKRKIFTLMLAIIMTVSGIPNDAWADEADNADVSVEMFDAVEAVGEDSVTIVESGECGENATYTLDSEGTLVISGSGRMSDYQEIGSVSVSPPFENFTVKDVVISDGITDIGACVFSNCRDLTSVTIPESVINICTEAFLNCDSLTNVTIPKGVKWIASSAFASCNKLTNINVDEENEEYKSFEGVLFDKNQEQILQYPGGKVGTYQIPESVTSIGWYAFAGCSGLTNLDIPESVISIGNYAFTGCNGLTNLDIPESVTSIGFSAFSDCSGLTSITISSSVTEIAANMFCGCNELTSVNIPNGVTSIGGSAFKGCNGLTSITIPANVMSIGDFAFDECNYLHSIEVDKNNQNYSSNAG